ncbi:hypothetical protein [Campylobacter sp.]|uniref:hypothetical protein n=1 Tax=Campylobacter sp. TaxID=205 RepID=UPI002A813A8F|nr:hypothetical protein [Campylobacter sp.]MDY4803795.1 hypothetical protein [Campylobacter sp.]
MRSNLYKNFSEIASVALLPRNDGYLMRLLRFARNDENSRIPYRDPPVRLGDDTRTPWDNIGRLAMMAT